MSPDKQQLLYTRHPAIFRDKDLPKEVSCLYWGIECGDGWFGILDALCEAVTKPYSCTESTQETGERALFSYEFPQVVASQVKEKFGGLRFYYDLVPDEAFKELAAKYPNTAERILHQCRAYVDGAIRMAETQCERTCEETGKPGSLCVRGGWYRTLCPERAAELSYITTEEWKRRREETEKAKA